MATFQRPAKPEYYVVKENIVIAGYETSRHVVVATIGDQDVGSVWAQAAFPDTQEHVVMGEDGTPSLYSDGNMIVEIVECEPIAEDQEVKALLKYLPVLEIKSKEPELNLG